MIKSANNKTNKSISSEPSSESTAKEGNSFLDNRPEYAAQMMLQKMANNSFSKTAASKLNDIKDSTKGVAQLQSGNSAGGMMGVKMNSRVAEIGYLNESRYEESLAKNNVDPLQLVSIQALGDFDMSLAEIVASMSGRAQGAALSMLSDFEEVHDGCAYYVAWNEVAGDGARYGLMSLKAVPPPAQDAQPDDGVIAGSLWVEGLVADAGGGLGGQLLNKAEEVAQQTGKAAVSLAAYEYDMGDDGGLAIQNPYSVAGYYEHKGYQFSGEGYVEVDQGREYFYPIYVKNIVE